MFVAVDEVDLLRILLFGKLDNEGPLTISARTLYHRISCWKNQVSPGWLH